jgi:hypothetical protein
MTNSDNGDALAEEILNSVSVEYGWLKNYPGLILGIAAGIVLVIGGIFFRREKHSNGS